MRKHITQVILIGLLVIALWAPKTARAYDDSYPKGVHSQLSGEAALLYGKIAGHFKEAVLPVKVYCIMIGAHDEDETDHVYGHEGILTTVTHFWDPDECVYGPGECGRTAPVRLRGAPAEDFANAWQKICGEELNSNDNADAGNCLTWQALGEYNSGVYWMAYERLGHICHLIQDMTVPAHAHEDSHPSRDHYEKWIDDAWAVLKNHLNQDELDKGLISIPWDVYEKLAPQGMAHCGAIYYLLYSANQRADYFASNDYPGDFVDMTDLGGWLTAEYNSQLYQDLLPYWNTDMWNGGGCGSYDKYSKWHSWSRLLVACPKCQRITIETTEQYDNRQENYWTPDTWWSPANCFNFNCGWDLEDSDVYDPATFIGKEILLPYAVRATATMYHLFYIKANGLIRNSRTSFPHYTIQEAIYFAQAGDVILVGPGTYFESIDLNKDITLRSTGGAEVTIINANGLTSVVQSLSANPTLEGFTLTGGENTNENGGGIISAASAMTIKNCIVKGNHAKNGGGMFHHRGNPTLINCAFVANTADEQGGGMWSYSEGSGPTLINCTFAANEATQDGGGLYNHGGIPTVTNCIFWGNQPSTGPQISGASTVNYSCVQGGWPAGTGNIDKDPLFVKAPNGGPDGWGDDPATPEIDESDNDDYGNLRLAGLDSPCLDSGLNAAAAGVTTDLAGAKRIFDGDGNGTALVDIGAFEFQARVLNTTQNKHYDHIQDAIDGAADGDEICAWPGTYHESIDPNGKAVRLYSNGGPDLTTISVAPLVADFEKWHPFFPALVSDLDWTTVGGGDPRDWRVDPFGNDLNWKVHHTTIQAAGSTYALWKPTRYMQHYILTLEMSSEGYDVMGVAFRYQDRNNHYLFWWGPAMGTAILGKYKDGELTSLDQCFTPGMPTPGMWYKVKIAAYSGFLKVEVRNWVGQLLFSLQGEDTSFETGGVALYSFTGNITGTGTWFDNLTVTPHRFMVIGTTSILFPHSHVVQCVKGEGPDTILEGFTITGGNAAIASTDPYYKSGGGMLNVESSPTVKNCIFRDNTALDSGGGMGNFNIESKNGNNPTVTDCQFINNTAVWGGGMANRSYSSPTVSGCTFTKNDASTSGAGMANMDHSNPTLANCDFSENAAVDRGGGVFNWGEASAPPLTNCTFSKNTAGVEGGGIFNHASYGGWTLTNCNFLDNTAPKGAGVFNNWYSDPTLAGCTFKSNVASADGGGMYNVDSNPIAIGCTFQDNTAANSGAGIYNNKTGAAAGVINCKFRGNSATNGDGGGMANYTSTPRVVNSTFSANSAGTGGGGIWNDNNSNPTVANCILWGNAAPTEPQLYGSAGITYSCVEGWSGGGTGNITVDPMFDAGTDLRLLPLSPCIDTGDNAAVPGGVTTDFAGDPRIADGDRDLVLVVDMGAYELPCRNTDPVANAGADQTLECDRPGGAQVTLDGSGSTDADSPAGTNDDIASFDWHEGVTNLGSGQTLTCTLPLGSHTVTLMVTDVLGASDQDDVLIVVHDTIPPQVAVTAPLPNQALRGSVTFAADASDAAGVAQVCFYVRKPNGADGVPIGHEDLPGTFNGAQWTCAFDATQLALGDYVVLAKAVDTSGVGSFSPVVPFSVTPVALAIDIYPNRTPNPVFLSRNYTLYVAVLGSATFDVSTLNSSTVRFGKTGTEASPVRAPILRDLNGDGFIDAMYGFMTNDCGFALGDTQGWLKGQTSAGQNVVGSDSVLVSP